MARNLGTVAGHFGGYGVRRGLAAISVAAAVAAALSLTAFWVRSQKQPAETYRTAVVDQGPIVTTVTANGTVNPVTTVQVGTYVSGRIIAIDVDFNSPVRRNQRVAKIDPAPFEVKVRKARASLENARAKLEKDRIDLSLKRLTYQRYQRLFARDLIARSDLDQARSDYEQARAQVLLSQAAVAQAEAELDDAQVNLAYTDIVSPVDGVVVSRNVNVGQTVAASFQTPTLFLIADDLTKMQVNAAVSESDIGQVREGQRATFTVDAYGERRFEGTVVQVRNAPTVVQNVVTYDVVLSVDNSDLSLKPGMTATVTIVTTEKNSVIRVPLSALRFRPGKASTEGAPQAPVPSTSSRVWVVRNGSIEAVDVTLGIRNDIYAELVSGPLRTGDQLAIGFAREGPERSRPPVLGGPLRFR